MDLKLILFTIFLLGSSSCCEFNKEQHSAVCGSFDIFSKNLKPEWTNLKIKNYGNTSLTAVRRKELDKTRNLTILALIGVFNKIGKNSLQGLPKLQSVEFLENKIDRLPSALFKNLPELTNLYLASNGIQRIDIGTFQDIKKLRVLSLRNNDLKIIPSYVVSSTNIEELYLEDNDINHIEPLAFINMPKLRKINLMGNKLSVFDVPLLFGSNSLNLDRIWLSKNKLCTIHSSTFALLPNLRYLFLEMNEIATIEDDAFKNLKKLVSLDISNNLLWEISPNVFPKENMDALELLLLHNNKFTYIKPEVFNHKPKLRFTTYYGNPLQCPCYNKIKDVLVQRNVSQICDDNIKESRPICIVGKDLINCVYDLESNKYLYEEYLLKSKNWEPWVKKCEFAEGYEHIIWAQYSS